jgi:DNA polymerase III subunit beta
LIAVALSDAKIKFAVGGIELISKLIDATFPDYQRVIPARGDHIATISTDALAKAVDRVSTVLAEKTKAVKFALADGKLTLITVDRETAGTATEELTADYAATAMETGFNAKYVLDMIAQIGGKSMRLVLIDGTSPARFEDADDDKAIHVIMPMRV